MHYKLNIPQLKIEYLRLNSGGGLSRVSREYHQIYPLLLFLQSEMRENFYPLLKPEEKSNITHTYTHTHTHTHTHTSHPIFGKICPKGYKSDDML